MEIRALLQPWRRHAPSGDDGGERTAGRGAGDELQARRAEIARMEERALREAESLEVQRADVERRVQALEDRERNVAQQTEELKRAKRVQRRELERISGLSAAQAKQILVADVEQEARHQAALRLQEIERETRHEAERRARNILSVAMQRLAARMPSDNTTRLVELPSDEMKGRIIGRDGRNIRALEKLTGVDVIIDETPSAVMLSSFDGVRREIARHHAGAPDRRRAHPSGPDRGDLRAGEGADRRADRRGGRAGDAGGARARPRSRAREAARQAQVPHELRPERPRPPDRVLRSSPDSIAAELGASVETARRAALLHDIGKAVSHEIEGPHAQVGARIAQRHGEPEAVTHAMEAHHNEVEPRTVEAVIVQTADSLSGARPGARGDSLEEYVSGCASSRRSPCARTGVERVYAMRAGREIRVIVDPGQVDDERAALISHEIAAAIERELEYPGQVKITVIRESRATAYAS